MTIKLLNIQKKESGSTDKTIYATCVVSDTTELVSEVSVQNVNGIPVVSGNSTLWAMLKGDMELYQPIMKAVGAYQRKEAVVLPMTIETHVEVIESV